MSETAALEANFWRLFGRTMGRPFAPGRHAQVQVAEWDSLRHVELMFELEEQFRVEVSPQEIVELFSDTDTILAFLRGKRASG